MRPTLAHISPDAPLLRSKLWIIGRGELSSRNRLGPAVRLLALAKLAKETGYGAAIVVDTIDETLFEDLDLLPLHKFEWGMVGEHDRVVITPHLPWRLLYPLLRGTQSFDVDSHGVGALEGMQSGEGTPAWRLFQGRRRTALRLRLLLHACDKIFLSVPEQLTFLGGSLFRESQARDVELASKLPEKTIFAPMGVNSGSVPDLPNPIWPSEIRDRPVFLWGGGIWSWFDIPTLLKAFTQLADQNHPAVLYFLAGKNTSGLENQDSPIANAIQEAKRLGLFGRNVFFNDGAATPDSLPLYLAQCRCGILSNPNRLESIGSWRTRLLDLLWAGKPVVVSGDDPLSRRMKESGCAIVVPAGDASALAEAVKSMSDNNELWLRSRSASLALGVQLQWSNTLAGIKAYWERPFESHQRGKRTTLGAIARCLIGL